MPKNRTCPDCGRPLPEDALGGLCPVCSLRSALKSGPSGAPPEIQHPASSIQPPASASTPPFVRDFGDYELLEEIARGGMGIVYKARQKSLDRIVALKLLLFGPQASPEFAKRFRAEAVLAASLQHPNIVAIHEVGVHEGQQFFVMDYVAGPSLARLVGRQPLPARRAAGYLKTVAEAVHYAHERGILHRDLKPSNVLIDANDQPRVTDFGLAKQLTSTSDFGLRTSDFTITGQVLGSPNYIPPEQALGKRGKLSRQSDVYALGAMLYHLLTGRPPFQGESLTDTLQQVLNTEPLAPRSLNPSVPRDLETICLKCLEKEAPRRYATAQELADELGRFLEDKPIHARPVSVAGKTWKWCRRRPVRASLGAALVLVLVLGAVGISWQWRRAEAARRRAESAEQNLTDRLWTSYLAEARANRWSGRAGRRFNSLEALGKAAAIRPSLELRNEAIACIALPDVRLQRSLCSDSRGRRLGFAINEQFERYACLREDGTLRIYRVSDEKELLVLPGIGTTEGWTVALNRDGRWLVQQCGAGDGPHFAVYDLEQGRMAFSRTHRCRSNAFAPDGAHVAASEPDGTIHIYALPSGQEVSRLTVRPRLIGMAYDPAGRRLAVSFEENPSVLVLDVETKAPCATLNEGGGVQCLAWSPDGQVLACAGMDNRVYLWQIASGRCRVLEGHAALPTEILFNHLGDMLVSGGWDGMTWFWDPKLGVPMFSIRGGLVPHSSALDDRRLAFTVTDHDVGIWEVEPARECRRLGRTDTLWEAGYSPRGDVLATASSDGVRVWNVEANRLLAFLPVNEIRSVSWAGGGRDLLAGGGSGVLRWSFGSPGSLELPPASHQVISQISREAGGLCPDGHTFIVAGAQKADVLVLDLDGLKQPRFLAGHPRASTVSISPTGRWFATGTWKGEGVKIWSTETWQPIRELPASASSGCRFSPDGAWLATGSTEEYCVWRTDDWERVIAIPRDQAGDLLGYMAFSPDGRMLALLHGRNRNVKLISVPGGRELATLDTGRPLCFSPDGGQLVTAGEDCRSLLVWDLRRIRQELGVLGLDWE